MLKHRIRCLIKQFIKRRGYRKKFHTYQILGCTYEELLIHLGPKPDGDIDLDHICPCAQATNQEEFLKLQHYSNLRWMNHDDNNRKKTKRTPEGELLCLKLLTREWID